MGKKVIGPIEKTFTDVVDSAFGSDDLSNYTVLTKRNKITYYLWSDTRLNRIKPTYLITHGWNSAAVGDVDFRALVAAIKAYDSTANVVFVEWTEYSNTLDYATAVSSTFKVGLSIAIALLELGINVKNTHLIGHSLGSHVLGCAAAEHAQRTINQSVQTIIALEPVVPSFENAGLSKRLDVTDARRVIAFHSASTLGYEHALGHLDIYLNKWSQDAQSEVEALTAIKTSCNDPILVLKDLFRGYAFRQRDSSLFTYYDLHTRLGHHHIDTRLKFE